MAIQQHVRVSSRILDVSGDVHVAVSVAGVCTTVLVSDLPNETLDALQFVALHRDLRHLAVEGERHALLQLTHGVEVETLRAVGHTLDHVLALHSSVHERHTRQLAMEEL